MSAPSVIDKIKYQMDNLNMLFEELIQDHHPVNIKISWNDIPTAFGIKPVLKINITKEVKLL